MSQVRALLNDLVDRKLWPVALALVAALVAVPVLLGGGSSEPAAAPAPAVPAAAADAAAGSAQAAITVAQAGTGRHNRPGAVRNPFVQHATPAASATATAPSRASSPPSSGGSAPTSSFGSPSVGLPSFTPSSGGGAKPKPHDTWRVNLRFGEAGNQRLRHDIPRLTPLPSSSNPFFVFVGVLSDGKTAVFLISSDAVPTGDGKCRPTPSNCQTVELRAGDVEFFDVSDVNNAVTQYELDLLKVSKHKVVSSAAAARAHKRENRDGRNVITEMALEGDDSLSGYMYSSRTGLIHRQRSLKAGASSNVPSDAASSRTQPQGAVWAP